MSDPTGSRGARVLCVDDNPVVTDALVSELRRGGHECVGVLADAKELALTVERRSANVVLLDLDMPGPDPLTAVSEMLERHPDVRVLVVSGHVRRDLVERALEVGAWAYLSKTDARPGVAEAIDRVLAGELVLGPDAQQVLDA